MFYFISFLFLLSVQCFAKWEVGAPTVWVQKDKLVAGIKPEASNNNVSIEFFENKLFMVWRSSKDHFASEHTITNVAYSEDLGKTWKLDLQFAIKADVREGLLKKFNDKLHLYYFEGGSSSTAI